MNDAGRFQSCVDVQLMTVEHLQPRPERAFERLFRAHAGDVYRYALAVTGNQADAEDVAQTTFLRAYRAFARGERPTKPNNWLIVIAHNVCRERYRQAGRRPTEVALDEDRAAALVPDEESPTASDIQRALGQLTLNQREALVMRELEGRTYNDIAEVLSLSVSAVETLLFRARRALREQLEGDLTCDKAEEAISLQRDGRLARSERGALRAHLRACPDCAQIARRQRAQRHGWKELALIPLPASLGATGGGISAGFAVGVASKAAAITIAAAAAGAGGYAVVRHETPTPEPTRHVPATLVGGHRAPALPRGVHVTAKKKLAVPPSAKKHADVTSVAAVPVDESTTPAAVSGGVRPAQPESAQAVSRASTGQRGTPVHRRAHPTKKARAPGRSTSPRRSGLCKQTPGACANAAANPAVSGAPAEHNAGLGRGRRPLVDGSPNGSKKEK